MWHKDVIPSDFDDLVVQLLGRLKEMTIKTKSERRLGWFPH